MSSGKVPKTLDSENIMVAKPSIRSKKVIKFESYLKEVFASTPMEASLEGAPKGRCGSLQKAERKLKTTQIENLKAEMIDCCLTHMQDSYRVHLNRLRGLEILDTIATRANINKITPELGMHMIWAALSCMHHFLLRLKPDTGFLQWIRRKQAKKAIRIYDKLLYFLTPTYYNVVFNAIITFFEEANIWDVEFYCSNLLLRLIRCVDENRRTESLIEIIYLFENSLLTNALTARHILQVIFDMQEQQKWMWMTDRLVISCLEKLYRALTPETLFDEVYEPLQKGFESHLRAMCYHINERMLMLMIKWMLEALTLERFTDENLMYFGSLLEFVTTIYCQRARRRNLPDNIIPIILKVIGSENLLYSLLGNRILHDMIDRCNNKLKFNTPRIFFRNSHYNIVLNEYNATDKTLFQRYREELHKTFVQAILKHGINKIHLENMYMSIVLFLVEIPCGYTAAAGVCLAMSIQEAALSTKNIQMTHAHRLHAAVVSIMSLVCYIHKAGVFYDYVETIIDRRANFAPQLNPPLKIQYSYAQHHVLWNKPDLFFEDWETRYGLWRCFKNKQREVVVMRS